MDGGEPVLDDGNADVNVHAFEQIKDERGLAAYSLKLAPGAETAGPDASKGNGQYIIVTKGSLNYRAGRTAPVYFRQSALGNVDRGSDGVTR